MIFLRTGRPGQHSGSRAQAVIGVEKMHRARRSDNPFVVAGGGRCTAVCLAVVDEGLSHHEAARDEPRSAA